MKSFIAVYLFCIFFLFLLFYNSLFIKIQKNSIFFYLRLHNNKYISRKKKIFKIHTKIEGEVVVGISNKVFPTGHLLFCICMATLCYFEVYFKI